MNKLVFQPAQLSDIPIIQDLAKQVWDKAYTPILSSIQIKYMLDYSYNSDTLRNQIESGIGYFFIVLEGQIVGFTGIDGRSSIGKLDKLYLRPDIQKSGIGRESIRLIEQYFKEMGCKSMYLHVNRYNAAVLFYLRCGFQIERVYDFSFGSGFWMNDYIMVKEL